ncbi:MAG: hypothetical protein JNL79_03640 [Myxococcales bacterium]|nr:hypothetical protein [Myxococcales bacterium]
MNQEPAVNAANTFPCAKCGGALAWDAGKASLVCPFCGHQQPMPTGVVGHEGVQEISIEEGYAKAVKGYGTPVQSIQCKDCGATVNVGDNERTTKCAFCGSHQVLQVENDANAIRPESLVPFQIPKEKASGSFTEWLSGLWFRPSDLSRMSKVQEIYGVYVPFWTFDAQVHSEWNAEAGYYYYETEYYTTTDSEGNTVQESRQVQYTRWEPAWGRRSDFYDDTLICASKGLPKELVDQFATFNTKLLVPYNPQYLAGWRAESYAIDLHGAHGEAKNRMAKSQEANCARDVPGDTHRNLFVNNTFSAETFKHVLLPVWIAAYRYKDKPYRFLVNGQTGEVKGEAPYSFWKIFFTVLAVVAVIAVIGYLVAQNNASKQEKKKKTDTEEESPKKKKKKKSSDDEGSLHRFHDVRDQVIVAVPV